MVKQVEFSLRPKTRGFHLVTDEIMAQLPELPQQGLLHLLVKHTSCGLALNENYDPDVRHDLGVVFNELVPEGNPSFFHTLEGRDDMPSHAKSVLSGVSLTLPITNFRLNLGTWQGIYLCEYRDSGGPRKIVAKILS